MMTELELTALAKTDLHCHLDGSLRPQTLIDLAQEQGVQLPGTTPDELSNALGFGKILDSLETYLKSFDHTCAVLQDVESLERVTYELLEDAAKEGVTYIEIRMCPTLVLGKGLTNGQVIEAIERGFAAGRTDFKIDGGQIIAMLRHHSLQENMALAEAAIKYHGKGVVGFDLAGGESGFPAKSYKSCFDLVHQAGVPVTIHAGEAHGPESIESAIEHGHAIRLGHGTTLIQDPHLMDLVLKKNIAVECCPTSNIHTKSTESYETHPLKTYLDAGLKVSLNTDNRLMSQTTVTNEFVHMQKAANLSEADIKTLIKNGFDSAFNR